MTDVTSALTIRITMNDKVDEGVIDAETAELIHTSGVLERIGELIEVDKMEVLKHQRFFIEDVRE